MAVTDRRSSRHLLCCMVSELEQSSKATIFSSLISGYESLTELANLNPDAIAFFGSHRVYFAIADYATLQCPLTAVRWSALIRAVSKSRGQFIVIAAHEDSERAHTLLAQSNPDAENVCVWLY